MRQELLTLLIAGVMVTEGQAQTIPPPTLSSPTNGAINQLISVTLSWKMPSGYYITRLEWDTTINFSATSNGDVTYGGHGYTLNLSYSTTYYWMAAATDAAGNFSAWAGPWSFTTAAPPVPTPPILASPSNGSLNQSTPLVLQWAAANAASSYRLQVSTMSNFSATAFNASGINNMSDTITRLTGAGTYYWHVNATNTTGTSAWSSVWRFTLSSSSIVPFNPNTVSSSFRIKNGIVSYFLNKQNPVEFRIYDFLGRKLFEFQHVQSAGNYSFSIKNSMPASALYIVSFKAGKLERQVTVMGK